MLRKKMVTLFTVIISILVLTACEDSTESKIIGTWEAVADGKKSGQYIEIGEKRIINKSESMTAEYILTELQNDTFMMEMINPEDGTTIPFFEGSFKGKDKIIIAKMMGEPIDHAEFIRVDKIEEDQAKDEKAQVEKKRVAEDDERQQDQEEQTKQKDVVQNEEETVEMSDDEPDKFTEESKYIMKLIDEGRLVEAKERLNALAASITSREYSSSIRAMDDMIEQAKYEREQKRETKNYSGLKEKYADKARMIDEKVEQKHKGDVPIGAFGDYLDDWDELLNEVWSVLKDAMPKDAFEKLKQEQIEWVKEKDTNYKEALGEIDAKDRLTNTTRERTYYLIETYLGK